MPRKAQTHPSAHEPLRRNIHPVNNSICRGEGAPIAMSERFTDSSFARYSKGELEGLIHVLIYRVDLLLSALKLIDWGEYDFTHTIDETEALLSEGAMYDVGHWMTHMIGVLERVAEAAEITAGYSMIGIGFAESSEQLEQALTELHRDPPHLSNRKPA